MRLAFLLLPFAATPALAHDGAHLHPHDGGAWLAVALVTVLALVVMIAWTRR